jgi:hypothetical protein
MCGEGKETSKRKYKIRKGKETRDDGKERGRWEMVREQGKNKIEDKIK